VMLVEGGVCNLKIFLVCVLSFFSPLSKRNR
jgi:hypothetical protein